MTMPLGRKSCRAKALMLFWPAARRMHRLDCQDFFAASPVPSVFAGRHRCYAQRGGPTRPGHLWNG